MFLCRTFVPYVRLIETKAGKPEYKVETIIDFMAVSVGDGMVFTTFTKLCFIASLLIVLSACQKEEFFEKAYLDTTAFGGEL